MFKTLKENITTINQPIKNLNDRNYKKESNEKFWSSNVQYLKWKFHQRYSENLRMQKIESVDFKTGQ